MKKVLISLMAAAAVLFVSSCAKEVLPSEANGNEATVSFAISLDDVATRAEVTNGNGKKCNVLVYEVYDAAGKKIDALSKTKTGAFSNGLSEEVKIVLAKGQKYSFAFWAQSSECQAYTTTDLQRVEIDYSKLLGNNDNGDAFFGYTEEIEVKGNFTHDVDLKRPFAQINLGISDIEAALAAELKVKDVTVAVNNVAANLNAKTGEVSGGKQITFSTALPLYKYPATPEAATDNEYLELKEAVVVDGENVKSFPWIAMNYILVNDATTGDTSANVDVTFTLSATDSKGEVAKENIKLVSPSTPVQRNYRTNIIGKLTSTGTFNIEILPGFDEFENNIVLDDVIDEETTPEDFYTILQKGGTVVVNADMEEIDFANLTLAKDVKVILNAPVKNLKLGGNTDANNVTVEVANGVEYPAITFNKNAKNITILGNALSTKALSTVISVGSAENITIKNIKATGDARIYASNAKGLVVEGCTATELNGTFIGLTNVENAQILSNTIAFSASANPDEANSNAIAMPYFKGNVLIEGNTITRTVKHGIFAKVPQGDGILTIKDNNISGVGEDGIKIDGLTKISATGNVIEAGDFGIRFDRIEKNATYEITGNTISILDGVDSEGKTTEGIRVRYRGSNAVTVNLTVKDNKVGTKGIPAGKYVLFTADNNTDSATIMTLAGDYNTPFTVADGVAISAEGNYMISSAAGMYWFADQVNTKGNSFNGKTVMLANDIDLENELWSPICQTGQSAFHGTFDGAKHTIKNLNVDETSDNANHRAAGLFGFIDSNWNVTIKNLTIDGAVIKAHHYVAAVAGYCHSGSIIKDCIVKNAKISAIWSTATRNDEDDGTAVEHPLGNNGDKAGAIVGYLYGTVENCHAEKCQIDAVRDAGALAGYGKKSSVSGTAVDVTVSNNDSAPDWATKNNTHIADTELIGRVD